VALAYASTASPAWITSNAPAHVDEGWGTGSEVRGASDGVRVATYAL